MALLIKTTAAALFLGMLSGVAEDQPSLHSPKPMTIKNPSPRIQAAILLDVSNSMDGLIEQAKSQLWNMVSVMGKAKCEGQVPQIEIALYEYGSPRNDSKSGYVRQISPFTTDLDGLSAKLFSLSTNGGEEFCGHVIYSSIDELKWDTSSSSYKVIFIAGNEDFLQGNIHYTRACNAAKDKGIIVNTIYCGDKEQGIREHWNLSAECGNGSYTNINQGIKEEYIPSPFDSTILVLNTKLNTTYVVYGLNGDANYMQQGFVDANSVRGNKSSALKRAEVKSNSNLYKNSGWDLVDASIDDSSFIDKVDLKTLPDSLQGKTRAELKQLVETRKQERVTIQNQIKSLNTEREKFIAAEKKKRVMDNQPTLQTETEKIIRKQAIQYNMIID